MHYFLLCVRTCFSPLAVLNTNGIRRALAAFSFRRHLAAHIELLFYLQFCSASSSFPPLVLDHVHPGVTPSSRNKRYINCMSCIMSITSGMAPLYTSR